MSEPLPNSRSPWRPILPPETADLAFRAVADITADLKAQGEPSRPASLSLAGGDAGLALFFAYLHEARLDEGFDEIAMELLDRAITAMGEIPILPSLYSGFSGVAWTVEHLRGRLYEDEEGEDSGVEVAEALVEHLALTPWQGQYDLISGLVGFGVYALERGRRPGGEESLRRTVARLAETAERGPQGVTWLSGPDLLPPRDLETFPAGYYNLGVAHGVPGVIALLALAQGAGVECRELLDGAVAWLLAQKLPAGAESIFSYNVAPGAEPTPTRLAWCYGDLGIAAALEVAARAVGEPEWEREALAIARLCATRPVEKSGAIDAGICHGAAGIAHLFNRLHQATGDPELREAAVRWIEQTLKLREPGKGIGGYEMWVPDDERQLRWEAEPGFLTGSAGVGLALLAAATAVEPEWDRVLEVSGK